MNAQIIHVKLENYSARDLQPVIYTNPSMRPKVAFSQRNIPRNVELKEHRLMQLDTRVQRLPDDDKELVEARLKQEGYIFDRNFPDDGSYLAKRFVYINHEDLQEVDPILYALYDSAKEKAKEDVKTATEILINKNSSLELRNAELKRQVKSLMDTMGDHNNQSWWRRIKRIVWSDGNTE